MHSSDSDYNLPPFPAFPSVKRFIGLGSVQDAVDRIELSIQARDAISVVIGPPGTGKTLISEILASRHQNTHRVITLGETPFSDSASFLRRMLHQTGADLTKIPGGDLQLALFDHLCLCDPPEPRVLLLIDEAQALSPELLETIRTLTNLTREGEPRVSVVMFGGNHLDELLIAPSMDGFRQRISTRCYLHPLNSEETGWYINQTIRNCGCDPDATITTEAISAVHHACSGVPRLINQLLSHAIEFAAEKDEYLLTDRIIDQSWAEVQQLPSPMVDEPEINLAESTVEFGELDSFDTPVFDDTADELTDNSNEQLYADTDSKEATADSATATYDAYDFEPDIEVSPSSEDEETVDNHQDSHLDPSPTDDVFTEVWDNDDEASLHDSLETTTEADSSVILTDASTNEHLSTAEITSPQLKYPQLASPALELDDELAPDNVASELSGESSNTPPNDLLFGTFDEEETIDLHAAAPNSERGSQHPTASIESALPQELIIHQEITGLSDLLNITAPDKIEYCDAAHEQPNKMHYDVTANSPNEISFDSAHVDFDESSVDSATLDFVSPHHGSHHQESAKPAEGSEAAPDTLQQDLHDSIDSAPKNQTLNLRHDDSDMLIIEDEVNIHRIDTPQNLVEAHHQSIDYQRMLKRMRSGT